MKYAIQNRSQYTILKLEGEFDSERSHEEYMKKIKSLFDENNTNIVLDLSDIEYICSADISIIMQSFRFVTKHNGRFIIFNCSHIIFSLMKMTRIDTIIPFFNSIEEIENFFNT